MNYHSKTDMKRSLMNGGKKMRNTENTFDYELYNVQAVDWCSICPVFPIFRVSKFLAILYYILFQRYTLCSQNMTVYKVYSAQS